IRIHRLASIVAHQHVFGGNGCVSLELEYEMAVRPLQRAKSLSSPGNRLLEPLFFFLFGSRKADLRPNPRHRIPLPPPSPPRIPLHVPFHLPFPQPPAPAAPPRCRIGSHPRWWQGAPSPSSRRRERGSSMGSAIEAGSHSLAEARQTWRGAP